MALMHELTDYELNQRYEEAVIDRRYYYEIDELECWERERRRTRTLLNEYERRGLTPPKV